MLRWRARPRRCGRLSYLWGDRPLAGHSRAGRGRPRRGRAGRVPPRHVAGRGDPAESDEAAQGTGKVEDWHAGSRRLKKWAPARSRPAVREPRRSQRRRRTTAWRLALANPDAITALIVQNGNAYDEGLDNDFWAPIKRYWSDNSQQNRDALRGLVTLDTTKFQYTDGMANASRISPDNWTADQALLDRPGNDEIQLDYFLDYGTNPELYPAVQEWLQRALPARGPLRRGLPAHPRLPDPQARLTNRVGSHRGNSTRRNDPVAHGLVMKTLGGVQGLSGTAAGGDASRSSRKASPAASNAARRWRRA